MTDSPEISSTSDQKKKQTVTPFNCLVGSLISGSLGYALYALTTSIVQTFAEKPLTSSNPLVLKIGSLVRTLVMGVASLATFVFAFVSFGLILLAIQVLLQKKDSPSSSDNS